MTERDYWRTGYDYRTGFRHAPYRPHRFAVEARRKRIARERLVRRVIAVVAVATALLFVYRVYQLVTYDELPVVPPAESRELLGD